MRAFFVFQTYHFSSSLPFCIISLRCIAMLSSTRSPIHSIMVTCSRAAHIFTPSRSAIGRRRVVSPREPHFVVILPPSPFQCDHRRILYRINSKIHGNHYADEHHREKLQTGCCQMFLHIQFFSWFATSPNRRWFGISHLKTHQYFRMSFFRLSTFLSLPLVLRHFDRSCHRFSLGDRHGLFSRLWKKFYSL